jgi:trimeric autotransporter adhesin
MAVRIQYRRGTAAEWTAANPTLAAGEAGYETDTAKFKFGNGSTAWNSLAYAGVSQTDITNAISAVIDGAPSALNTLNELAAALNDDASFSNTIVSSLSNHTSATTNVHGIANTALLITTTQFDLHTSDTTDVHGIANTALLATQSDASNAAASAVSSHSSDTTDVHGIANTALLITQSQLSSEISALDSSKAPLNAPSFTGTVVLPSTTSIGDVSAQEISYLNNVSSAIQTQLDGKLATSTASTTYAALTGATFTGNVVLTANTSIGTVDSIEIGYLNGVTSAIQTQLDAKAPTANPTFTGTVSGVTKSMVGLGNVDNTADADKPISTATQTALNAKLSLAGGTMTGDLTLAGAPTQALHAATKAYVDNVSAGLHIHEAAHAATSNTLAVLSGGSVTYNNGTDGVGATLTLGTALTTLDGHALTNGDRILVKNEANAAHNGVYARTSSTVLTRADDFNTATEIAGGDLVFVENGTLYNSTSWVVENEVNTVGTDNVLWAQFSGAGTVTAGNNISVTGLQVSVVSNPTFGGLVTLAANGIAFTDGTQTAEGVPSRTVIIQRTSSNTLSGVERDDLIEMSNTSATTLTIPADSTFNFPVGTSIDVLQTNTGQVTIAGAGGVTVNATPGLKLRTQWSSATLFKRAANTWVVYGDLTA